MANLIQPTDTLAQGYPKINAIIEDAEESITTANNALEISNTALNTANNAAANSLSTQEQLDAIVIQGDSSVEAAQARVNADNTVTHGTLKERLDAEYNQIIDLIQGFAVNAKEQGVKGDGITNDTVALQNVLDTYPNIYVPEGTYIIDNITVPSTVKAFIGSGDNTVFKPYTVSLTNNLFTVGNMNNGIIANFKIDASFDLYPTLICIHINQSAMSRLQNIHFENAAYMGIQLLNCSNCVVDNCKIYSWGQIGIYLNGTISNKKNKITNNHVEGHGNVHGIGSVDGIKNVIKGNTVIGASTFGINTYHEEHSKIIENDVKNTVKEGINIQDSSYVNIIGNDVTWDIDGLSEDFGISLYGPNSVTEKSYYNIIANNNISNSGKSGIGIAENASHNSISDNMIVNVNKLNETTGCGVHIYGTGAEHNKVDGNNIVDTTGSGNLKYGIAEFNSNGIPNNNFIENNKIVNASVSVVLRIGTNSKAFNNSPAIKEEEISLTFITGVTGKCIKNNDTGLVKLEVTLDSNIANGATLVTLPAGTRPSSTQTCRRIAKQTTGMGRCALYVNGAGVVSLSGVDYGEPMAGTTFNLVWKV